MFLGDDRAIRVKQMTSCGSPQQGAQVTVVEMARLEIRRRAPNKGLFCIEPDSLPTGHLEHQPGLVLEPRAVCAELVKLDHMLLVLVAEMILVKTVRGYGCHSQGRGRTMRLISALADVEKKMNQHETRVTTWPQGRRTSGPVGQSDSWRTGPGDVPPRGKLLTLYLMARGQRVNHKVNQQE
jgi:hypothetical protein